VNDALELGRLAEEQAALRRVATLVAQGAPRRSLFTAVAEQVASVLDVRVVSIVCYAADGTAIEYASVSDRGEFFPVGTRWSLDGTNVVAQVRESCRPARIDDYSGLEGPIAEAVRSAGIRSTVGGPIVVAGDVWGVMVVSSTEPEPLPADTEARLTDFTELVATAIANADARAEVERLADEQAALRRVATLVAEVVPPSELFGAVAEEAGRLLRGVDVTVTLRFESDTAGTVVGEWGDPDPAGFLGDRLTLEGDGVAELVLRTGQPARIDDYSKAGGSTAALVRAKGVRTALGVPIIVEGRLWGAFILAARVAEPLPADTEARVERFTELVATAIANAETRAEVERLADEQAALRRVATLVAKGVPPSELFASVAEETGRLMRADGAVICRYEADGGASVVAGWGVPDVADVLGTRLTLDQGGVIAEVRRTGRPARSDDYAISAAGPAAVARSRGVQAGVAVPIVVEGRLWGAMFASSRQAGSLPPDVEPRIGEFTELVATAISNTQARTDLAASRARLVAASDEERQRVVRDLHDGAQQRLVLAVVKLKMARRALDEEEQASSGLVTEALQHAEQANVELRELAHGILPAVLTSGGLHAGVGALASRAPLPVENDVSVGRLPIPVEATAYFVVAEALTNVVKHSHATRAVVTARVEDGTLHVDVGDDGVGGARAGGSGLVGLGDRLAALDGRLHVESSADGGTLVAADIPLPPQAPRA
jgi:signal transduction histidine kinase